MTLDELRLAEKAIVSLMGEVVGKRATDWFAVNESLVNIARAIRAALSVLDAGKEKP